MVEHIAGFETTPIPEFLIVFKDVRIEYNNVSDFKRTWYFQDKEQKHISNNLKEILFTLFNVDSKRALYELLLEDWVLIFRQDDRKSHSENESKTVVIYDGEIKIIVEKNKEVADSKRIIKKIIENPEEVSAHEIGKVLKNILKASKKIKFTEQHKKEFIKMIPELIKSGELKLEQFDVSDINKRQIKTILDVGYGILNKKQFVCKHLGIDREDLSKEKAWQKYFEKYGDYLLFGAVDISSEVPLVSKEVKDLSDSRTDIITINRYGFIDIVELKQSDFELFKYDKSHDNFYSTPLLSKSISQLIKYLMVVTSSLEGHDKLSKGIESASGLLVIGSTKSLITKATMERVIRIKGYNEEKIIGILKKHLRELNYSLAHIDIVLYDDLLNTLRDFTSKMKIR